MEMVFNEFYTLYFMYIQELNIKIEVVTKKFEGALEIKNMVDLH